MPESGWEAICVQGARAALDRADRAERRAAALGIASLIATLVLLYLATTPDWEALGWLPALGGWAAIGAFALGAARLALLVPPGPGDLPVLPTVGAALGRAEPGPSPEPEPPRSGVAAALHAELGADLTRWLTCEDAELAAQRAWYARSLIEARSHARGRAAGLNQGVALAGLGVSALIFGTLFHLFGLWLLLPVAVGVAWALRPRFEF